MPDNRRSSSFEPGRFRHFVGVVSLKQNVLALSMIIAIGMFWPVCQPVDAGSPTVQIANIDESTVERIDKLVRELGSPSYAVRQSAVEQLWEFGAKAQPALERAAANVDSEIARRSKEILSVLSMGIDKNTSPEIARLVLHFHSSELTVRTEVLTKLVKDGKFQLVFDLLGQVKNDDDQYQLFDKVLDFDNTLIGLARSDRWDDFEFILGHPITLKHRASAAVHYLLVNGTLAAKTNRLRIKIKTQENEGKSLKSAELFLLVGIFRLQGDYQSAMTYAKKIKDADQRAGIVNQLLLEQGDWNAIARNMVRPDEDARSVDGKILVTPAQRALVHQFVGNKKGYDDTVNELLTRAAEFQKDQDEQNEREIRDTLIEIGLANLDWPLVESNLNPDEPYKSFRLNVSNNRTEKAFKIVGLGTDVEQRNSWFNRRVRNIQSLRSKSKRLEKNGQDNDDVIVRLNQTWENAFQIAGLLGGLGLTDESVLHFQTLFAALASDDEKFRRFNVIQELVELERYEEVWMLIENGFDSSHYRQLISYIFPNRPSWSRSWYERMKTRYPDPLERLKVTSGILNSPLGTIPSFDLQVELAGAFLNPLNRYVDYYLGKIYEFHGDEELSRQHMSVSRELGWGDARKAHALESLEQGDYETAIEFFDQAWQTQKSGFETVLAADAYRKIGDPKNAMLRECLAYAMWRGAFQNSGTILSLEAIDKLHLIRDVLKLEIIRIEGVSISNERYRTQFAAALHNLDPVQSSINQQLALFNAASGDPGTRSTGFWSESRKQINTALARSKIASGDFAEALQLLLQYNEFCPGDPDIGEKFIGQFDQAGATQQANTLFEKLTEPYFEILEQYPDSSFHHNNYAWICACANRRTDHMLRHSLKACAERPNSSTFKDTLAEIYFLQGDTEVAIELCRRCIEINPIKRHYRQQLKRFQAGQK